MKYLSLFVFVLLVVTSCQKEAIVPFQESEEMDVRNSTGNPDDGSGDNSGITDPDDESEDDKVKNKKKKAK
jgi:hypothetical protein